MTGVSWPPEASFERLSYYLNSEKEQMENISQGNFTWFLTLNSIGFIIYLESEKYQFELCSKYDFDIILG